MTNSVHITHRNWIELSVDAFSNERVCVCVRRQIAYTKCAIFSIEDFNFQTKQQIHWFAFFCDDFSIFIWESKPYHIQREKHLCSSTIVILWTISVACLPYFCIIFLKYNHIFASQHTAAHSIQCTFGYIVIFEPFGCDNTGSLKAS